MAFRRSSAYVDDASSSAYADGTEPAERTADAVREARPWHTPQPASAEHLALGILAVSEGLVPPILSAIGTSGPALSAAIRHRYHQAR